MNKDKLIYLAGIIDGEGCIAIRKDKYNKPAKFSVGLTVVNTSENLIFWLKENFDGKIYFREHKNKNWKTCWVWYIGYKKAVILLKKVLSYLIIKKQQAKLAIEFQKTIVFYGKNGIPEEILKQREDFYNLMKQLNRKGKV